MKIELNKIKIGITWMQQKQHHRAHKSARERVLSFSLSGIFPEIVENKTGFEFFYIYFFKERNCYIFDLWNILFKKKKNTLGVAHFFVNAKLLLFFFQSNIFKAILQFFLNP